MPWLTMTYSIYSIQQQLAEVAELADALGSGPSVRKDVGVRIPASAPDLKIEAAVV